MEFIFEMPEQAPMTPQPQQMMPQPMQQEQQMMPSQQQPMQHGNFIFEMPEQPYFNPEMPKNESWGQTLARVPVGLASTAAKSFGKTYDLLSGLEEGISTRLLPEEEREAFTKERAKMPYSAISEKGIEESIGKLFPKKYREPKDNIIEKGLHMVAGEAPWVALALASGGTSAAGALAGKQALKMAGKRAAGSLAGSEGAKAAGLDEFWQGVGGLVGSFGPDILQLTTHQFAKNLQPQLYAKGKELSKGLVEKGSELSQELKGLDRIVSGPNSGLKDTSSREVQKQIEKAKSLIYGSNIAVQDAVDQHRALNDIIKVTPGAREAGYYEEMKSFLEKVLDKARDKFPTWGKAYDEAQDLTKVIGGINTAESTLKKATDGLTGLFPPLKLIKPFTWTVDGLIPSEFMPYLKNSPKTATKYLGKIIQHSLTGDVASVRRNLLNMNKLMKHEDKKMKRTKR